MKILVYGAGVIGCELAHMLAKAGNDVILFARGKWREAIDKSGLMIRHYAQLYTTTDKVATIEKLKPNDIYDIIFVVMQYGQIDKALPDIATNHSRFIVLIGNNMDADVSARILASSQTAKEVAFGFQATGGRRENGKVISIHASVGMTIGGLHAPLSEHFHNRITEAFAVIRYRLTWEENMDSWLKCHLAFILPVAYICYATDFHLERATRRQRSMAVDAAIEGYYVLKKLGYPIRPAGSDAYLLNNRLKVKVLLWLMAKTPLGRLAASDHCRNAGEEMILLDAAFERIRKKADTPTPNWDALRSSGQPHFADTSVLVGAGRKIGNRFGGIRHID